MPCPDSSHAISSLSGSHYEDLCFIYVDDSVNDKIMSCSLELMLGAVGFHKWKIYTFITIMSFMGRVTHLSHAITFLLTL